MNCQSLFSGKTKKKKHIKIGLLTFIPKYEISIYLSWDKDFIAPANKNVQILIFCLFYFLLPTVVLLMRTYNMSACFFFFFFFVCLFFFFVHTIVYIDNSNL